MKKLSKKHNQRMFGDVQCRAPCNKMNHGPGATYLFEVSAIPAKALYQARNAARIPNPPPALMSVGSGAPSTRWRLPIPSIKKAKSSVKKSMKNATVDFRVQIKRRKVKMNQP
jgi:hypothetical protein